MVLLHDALCIGKRSANRNPMLNLCHRLCRLLGKPVTVRASADGEHESKCKNFHGRVMVLYDSWLRRCHRRLTLKCNCDNPILLTFSKSSNHGDASVEVENKKRA